MKNFLFATFTALVAASAGCHTTNSLYCDNTTPCTGAGDVCNVNNACVPGPDAPPPDAMVPDATPLCTVDPAICVSGSATPACAPSGTCVACIDNTTCSGTTPVCESYDTCGKCVQHSDCASDVCLPDGSCADPTTVAYVAAGSSAANAGCTQAAPCSTLSAALLTSRSQIKMSGAVTELATVTVAKAIAVYADAEASLTVSPGRGPVILFTASNASLAIADLTITGAANTSTNSKNGFGIQVPDTDVSPTLILSHVTVSDNQGSGLSVSGATVSISRSTFAGNQGGGISLTDGSFDIVNNIFFGNGGGSNFGGVRLSTSSDATNRLQFNSFSGNTSSAPGSAVQCSISNGLSASNNIVSGTDTYSNEVTGNCTFPYSIIFTTNGTPGPVPAATGLQTANPMFVTSPTGDLHITSGSPALHAADPAADLTGLASVDFDGETRVAPTDIGADQFSAGH